MTDAGHDTAETAFPPSSSRETVDLIGRQFGRLTELSDWYGVFAGDVSGWSVGRHVLHLALSGSSMAVSIVTGRHWDGVPSAPELKDHILHTGRIPAGRAKAPESVRPESDPGTADILRALKKCRLRVARIPAVSEEACIVHPYLGQLNRDELICFLAIHNRHHLDIIGRIIDGAG